MLDKTELSNIRRCSLFGHSITSHTCLLACSIRQETSPAITVSMVVSFKHQLWCGLKKTYDYMLC